MAAVATKIMTQTKQDCSTPDQLLTFLRGQLSAREEADLQHHLDDCVSCRERLESTAADVSVWKEAREFFASGALQNSSKDSSEDHEETNQVQYRIRQVLDSLGPTDDPESLGRIGGYEVTGVVGAGGMGVVLKAHDRSLDRIVAIKVMSPHLSSSGSARKRFAREAKAAAAVLHPNVIAIHSVASEDANPYLVMPFVRGTSLQKRIDSQGPLPLKDTLRIGAQIAAGLAAAHEQGLVHRDIKPANILLEEGVERVTITDFGLARAVDDASMTCSGVIAGTPQYMSPEQARGEPIDARSDLFSLGGVLYAMCTGRSPFRAETTYGVLHRIANDNPTPVCEVNTDVPVWLGHLIERLMAKRPEDRFESAAQVAELLEGCLAHVQQPAAMPLPETVTALAPIKTRRPPIGKLIVAAAFALAFIFAGVFVVLELNKGTLTIQSDVDDIRVRITRGEDVVNELKVTKSGQSVRTAAGQYQVELIGETDGLTVENGQVTLHRADTEVVKIVHNGNNANPPTYKNPNEIWSADSAGKWPMTGGVTLEVKRELFHGADVETSAVLTWPEDATGTTHAFSSSVASDAFGNREPWHVAWERNSASFWTIRGNLGDHGPGLAKLFCVNRVDFADKSKIVTTTWYHRPDGMPKGIQLAFEKFFEPLPTTPRRASEAEGSTRVEQAHDVRPIEELLHGVWKSSSSEPRVQMTFPEQDTGDVQWTIDYGKGTPSIDAKLAMIRVPANNAIRLWIRPSQLSNVDERDIIGTVRRGPDSTLLLDITGSPKFPDYKKVLGIVLSTTRVPGTEVPDDKVESTGQDASKASTGETLEVSLAPKSVDQKTTRASTARTLNDQVIDALVTFEFSGVVGNATLSTSGIGWVIDQHGHILVPAEIAPRSEDYSIEVRYADGSRTSAKRVFTFGHLALLKPEKAPAIAPIKLNSKQAVQDGDQVLAILNGTDVQKGTVTSAKKTIVSLDSWPILYSPRLRFPNAIETDFKSDPATLFGAPLLTPSGEVVGMLLNYKPPMFAIPLSEIQVACREFEASHIQAAVNSAEATIAAEEAVAEHSEILPATIDDERASNAVKRVMQYLTAVKEKDSETINSIAKGLRKHEKREKDMATLLIDGGIPKFYKTWFVNHSAVVALGPLSTSDKQMNGRFLLFTLSLVDEQWSIVDVDLEVEERLLERFKNPIQAAEGTPETANSKSNADEKNSSKSSIIVDVYGGNRVLGQNNAKYGKMVQALDAIDDVQVNFREAGPGSDIVLAIVRDRNGLMNQEANSTGKPSARRDAITKALGQVPTVRWEEGVLGVSLERNQPPVVGEQAETVNSAATADEAYQAMEKLLVNAKMDWKSTERYIAIAATRMTSNIEFAKYVLDRFRIACEGGESNYQARRHLLAVLTKAFHAWGQNRWSTDPASIEQHAKPSKTWPQEIRDFELSALESVVSYGYKATRSDIVDFVRAARALHHPDAKPFLQAVLLNPQSLNSSPFATPAQAATPPKQSTWSDNVGGSWPDARFVAAVGLAELGDPSAIDWLLDKAQPKDFGFESIYQERHERDRSDSLRESSRCALIDLFGHPKDLTAIQLSDWWKMNRAVVTRRMVRLKSDFATKIETLQERILANARIVVEAYVASAISGNVAQASDLAKNSPADPKRIQELPEFLNVQRLKIETVYVNDPAKPTQALATSEAVKLEEEHKNPDGRRDGFMVFTLELTDERWFVIDIDFETESGAEKKLNKFLEAHPNSIGIPPQS